MSLLDLLTAPWAIAPEKLREMQAVYATHLRGERIDLAALEARLGRPLANEQQAYTVREGGVAVLPIEGVLAPKANLLMRISGGASTQMLAQQLESAMADGRVRSVVQVIDSPGGSVHGGPEYAALVRRLGEIKPIVTVSDVQMLSMGCWIGVASSSTYITGPTVLAGSVGVVVTHDYDPRASVVKTEITAGRYKRIATSNEPLTVEGRAYLQGQADHLYSVFVDAVAAYRGVDADTVLEHMADGRVFIGAQAIEAGLVDGFATVDEIVEQLASKPEAFSRNRPKAFALGSVSASTPGCLGATSATHQERTMDPKKDEQNQPTAATVTREALERDNPTLFAQMRQEFTAAGAAAERERIAAVRAQLEPGQEGLIDRLAMDGKTTGPEAAVQVLAALREQRKAEAANGQQQAAQHFRDAPAAAAASAAPADKTEKTRDEQVAEAKAYAAEHKVDFLAAVKKLGIAA